MNRLGQLFTRLAVASTLVCCVGLQPARAQQTWSIATAYPADTVAGRGVEFFASALTDQTGGKVLGKPEFKAKAGATDLVSAVQDGRLQVADVFGGSLAQLDSIFELPTLPFQVHSLGDSQRLTCVVEPLYRRALLRAGLHMLFISPWPPTGLWSRVPVADPADMTGMRVRTYDDSSAQVLTGLGMRATALSVQDVRPLLRIGALDGVLSSGDGAVGRSFHGQLPNFTAIHYAFPVSFVVMSQTRYEALPDELRAQLDKAAKDVQRRQWATLPARIRENYAAMRLAGVNVNTSIDDGFRTHLREAGDARMKEWLARVPAEYGTAVKAFLEEAPSAQSTCPISLLEAQQGARG